MNLKSTAIDGFCLQMINSLMESWWYVRPGLTVNQEHRILSSIKANIIINNIKVFITCFFELTSSLCNFVS